MRDHEPAVRVILETVDLELIPICDDFSKVINFVPVTGMQLGGAVHVCKTLEEGRPELAGYLRLLDIYEETSRAGPADPDGQTLAELCRKEPAVKEILEAIDRAMAGFDISQPEGRQTAREAVTTSLKIVDALDQLDWQMARRMSDGPVLAVDQLHPWVRDEVMDFCETGHYRQADQTVKSRQRSVQQYALGCYAAIRNPASHEHREWGHQVAIEYLAALSVLARWIDDWTVVTAP
jgi:hypothetical protein